MRGQAELAVEDLSFLSLMISDYAEPKSKTVQPLRHHLKEMKVCVKTRSQTQVDRDEGIVRCDIEGCSPLKRGDTPMLCETVS